jgi:hypothetical protein
MDVNLKSYMLIATGYLLTVSMKMSFMYRMTDNIRQGGFSAAEFAQDTVSR